MNRFKGAAQQRGEHEQPREEEVRVTDRRRIHLDNDGPATGTAAAEEPNLKPSYVEELEARTKAAEEKLTEVQNRFDQLRAQLQRETDETRQRLNRAADERAQRQNVEFIAALLPTLDNLQRAVEAAVKEDSSDSVIEGLKSTMASFESALTAAGAEPIKAIDQRFDPQLHEAVDIIPVEEDRDGLIVTEYTSGYKIGDRLLRPARVQVGRSAIS